MFDNHHSSPAGYVVLTDVRRRFTKLPLTVPLSLWISRPVDGQGPVQCPCSGQQQKRTTVKRNCRCVVFVKSSEVDGYGRQSFTSWWQLCAPVTEADTWAYKGVGSLGTIVGSPYARQRHTAERICTCIPSDRFSLQFDITRRSGCVLPSSEDKQTPLGL